MTPRCVSPPLSPSKAKHGGEYGSPWIWRSPHDVTPAAAATSPPPVAPVPAWPASPPRRAGGRPRRPAAGAGAAAGAPVPLPPPVPLPLPEPLPLARRRSRRRRRSSGDFVGTSSDISEQQQGEDGERAVAAQQPLPDAEVVAGRVRGASAPLAWWSSPWVVQASSGISRMGAAHLAAVDLRRRGEQAAARRRPTRGEGAAACAGDVGGGLDGVVDVGVAGRRRLPAGAAPAGPARRRRARRRSSRRWSGRRAASRCGRRSTAARRRSGQRTPPLAPRPVKRGDLGRRGLHAAELDGEVAAGAEGVEHDVEDRDEAGVAAVGLDEGVRRAPRGRAARR